ncbi:hypothetical protein ACFPM7_03235 [Actinokineospora guangxiensis]|uniref:PE family protein n=1 Tax=Actinokineospora guangxiensis TaxID=1490288 RepID=A0ABW0EIN1_9PSEU
MTIPIPGSPGATFPYDQARLEELIAGVDARIADVERTAVEAAAAGNRAPGLSEKDIAEIERAATAPGAPKEMRDMVQRIKDGELSWSDVLSGRALDDEGVQAAMAANVEQLRQAHDAIREGQDPQDIIDALGGGPRGGDDDDPDGGGIMRSAW